jgi:tetratricopeptide (TPR) repeat protein
MRWLSIVLISVLGLASCSRDPNFVKKRYLDRGNVYFERGKYKEAAIMYKDALQKDQRYGPAHYKLALTYLKEGQLAGMVSELRKAVELLPKSDPDHWDAVVKLSEIYIAEASKDKIFMQEVQVYIHDLLTRDPNSFDGRRLSGDYNFRQAFIAFSSANADQGHKLVAQAEEEYLKAAAIRPKQKELQMQMARVMWAENKLPEAEKYYWDVIGEDKTYQIAYEELTKIQILQNQIPDAEKTLKLAYQNNPKQFRFLTQLAGFYSSLNQQDNMIGVLNQIKGHAADFPNAYLVVGDFYYRKHELAKAEKEYREGMAVDSKRKAEYRKRIIEVLLVEGKKTEAVEINNQILAANPNDDYAKGLQASMMLDSGEVNKALEQLQAVVSQAPQNPVAHYNLARAHLLRGEIEQARQQLEKAVEIRPDYVLARTKLAQIEIARGEWDSAMKTAGQILAVDRNSLVARLIQAGALIGQQKSAEARALLQNMLKLYPSSPDVLLELGELDVQEKKLPEAMDTFRHSYQLNPGDTRSLVSIIQVYMLQGKGDEAVALLQSESAKAPTRSDITVLLGSAAVQAGKYDVAIPVFQSVLDSMDPKSKARSNVYMRLGEAYRKKGDLQNALSCVQKARELTPESTMVLTTLAVILDMAGRWTEAKQVYDATLRIHPDDGQALNNDAYLMAEHGGDLDQALTYASRAKQLLPDNAEVSDTLSWIYIKKQMSQNAVDILSDVVQKQPNASTYRYHLAMALAQKGDKPHALKEAQEALRHSPTAEERQKIQDLIAKTS